MQDLCQTIYVRPVRSKLLIFNKLPVGSSIDDSIRRGPNGDFGAGVVDLNRFTKLKTGSRFRAIPFQPRADSGNPALRGGGQMDRQEDAGPAMPRSVSPTLPASNASPILGF